MKQRRFFYAALLLTLTLLIGCAANPKPVTLPPGALNQADATIYQSLRGAQAVLNSVKADFDAGKVPASAKPALNTAIASYNAAENAWKAYHAAGGGDTAALTTAVQKAVADVAILLTQATGGH